MKLRIVTQVILTSLALHAAPRKAAPARVKLTDVVPSAELSAAMKPYGFKAYRCTDGTNTYQCLAYAPKVGSSKGLPLLVYIPGTGERGDLINQFRQPMLFDRVLARDFQAKHPCHLLAISPSESVGTLLGGLPGEPNEEQRLLHDMIFELAKRAVPKVDPKRIYTTGFSYGGDGAYALMLHYPQEIAAALPIAALPPLEPYFNRKYPGNMWDVYNEGDRIATGRSDLARKRFRDLTNAAGGDFRMSTYPAAGHNAWDKAWREDEVWDWMFAKSLGVRKAGVKRNQPAPPPAYATLTGLRCTASIAGRDAQSGPERALDGLDATGYVPAKGFRKSDWWQVEFPQPASGKVCLYSGDKNGAYRIRNAVVEVSSNGRTWRKMAAFSVKDGTCGFTTPQKFSHLRVRFLDDLPQTFMLRRMTLLAAR